MSKAEGGDVPPAGRVRFIEFGASTTNAAVSYHSCTFNRVDCRAAWLAPIAAYRHSLQLRVLRFGLFENGHIRVSVLPKR
jgi:hypothetical protein